MDIPADILIESENFHELTTFMPEAIHNYNDIFVRNTPLLDVRAPIEYQKGAFPNSANFPIMDDREREIVGICYKTHGQEQALEKGHEMVQGKMRETRIRAWLTFAQQNPQGSLYCFRGGLRSKIAQQWMHDAGMNFPIIHGGYKALRNHLLKELETAAKISSFKLVGGNTGCGKTILVRQLKHGIDLEAAAYHRGSSFGRHATEQNNQINFENIIAIDFIKLRYQQIENETKHIILEDEGRTIGRVGIPKTLFTQMRNSPLVVIDEPLDARIERLAQEYVLDMHQEFIDAIGTAESFNAFSHYLLNSLEKVQKRLGPARYVGVKQSMQQALERQAKTGEINKHYDWLHAILTNYYDPMYEDQLTQRQQSICFRGNFDACKEYLGSTDLL